MGGGLSSLSKVVVLSTPGEAAHTIAKSGFGFEDGISWADDVPRSKGPAGWDVVYRFAQVGVTNTNVDWRSTCGNLVSAVAHVSHSFCNCWTVGLMISISSTPSTKSSYAAEFCERLLDSSHIHPHRFLSPSASSPVIVGRLCVRLFRCRSNRLRLQTRLASRNTLLVPKAMLRLLVYLVHRRR